METLTGKLQKMADALPKPEPYQPSPFTIGVAHELRAIADQIENGAMVVSSFSLITNADKEKLEIEVTTTDSID